MKGFLQKSVIRRLSAAKSCFENYLEISEQVQQALSDRKCGVVALESTVITHGMPYPENLNTAKKLEQIVRQNDCVPATVAIMDGKIHVGLCNKSLERLASAKNALKVSRRDLPVVLTNHSLGGTTVSATMIAAHIAGIDVFATGGIGGVHRDCRQTMDISCDLRELGRTPVCVVCAGVKSILDIPKTLEYLETEGVPVITFGKHQYFPGFYAPKSSCLSPHATDSLEEIAKLIYTSRQLNLGQGILIGVPIQEENQSIGEEMNQCIEKALEELRNLRITGKEVTPFLLKRVNELSHGQALQLNVKLLENNAYHGALIAKTLIALKNPSSNLTPTPHFPANCDFKLEPKSVKSPEVVSIGGSLIDCYSYASEKDFLAIEGWDQNVPGRVAFQAGGVARNHSDALQQLGVNNRLITVIGRDTVGSTLKQLCSHMDRSAFIELANEQTASYIGCMIDGRLKYGVLSVDIFKRLNETLIEKYESDVAKSKLCFIDANLTPEAIQFVCHLCNKYNVPVFFEPTDRFVAGKIFQADCWSEISFTSPNRKELEVFLKSLDIKGSEIIHENDTTAIFKYIVSVAPKLMKDLKKSMLITLDSQGVILIDKVQVENQSKANIMYFLAPKVSKSVVNVSGSGDSLNAGYIFGVLNGWTSEKSISFGLFLAKISLESAEVIPNFGTGLVGRFPDAKVVEKCTVLLY